MGSLLPLSERRDALGEETSEVDRHDIDEEIEKLSQAKSVLEKARFSGETATLKQAYSRTSRLSAACALCTEQLQLPILNNVVSRSQILCCTSLAYYIATH